MRHLGQPYYVGLLSATAIHGAGRQQPMVFQVLTSKPTRQMRAGKVAIRGYRNLSRSVVSSTCSRRARSSGSSDFLTFPEISRISSRSWMWTWSLSR